MKTRAKHKLVILITLIIAVAYFFNDFSLIDVEKTAIIVALGIDKCDDGVEITAQIGVPHATEKALDNTDTLISSKGKTVMDAIETLSARSGWFPKLSFCNFIVFGKELAYLGVTEICNHILSSEHFQNSALLAVSDGTAKDFLKTPTPLDSISSFAVQKVLIENGITSSRILDTDVKKFSESTKGRSECGYMPFISIIEGDAKGEEDSSAATTALIIPKKTADNGLIDGLLPSNDLFEGKKIGKNGSDSGGSKGGSGGGGESQNGSPSAIFDAGKTAIFKDGKIVDTLSEKETIAYNLLCVPADSILVNVENNEKNATLEIFYNAHKVKACYDYRPTLKINLSLTVRIADGNTGDNEDNALGWRATVPKEFLDALKEDCYNTLYNLATRMANKNIDLFGIRNLTYKYHNFNYEDYKKIPLSDFKIDISVKTFSRDSTSKPR